MLPFRIRLARAISRDRATSARQLRALEHLLLQLLTVGSGTGLRTLLDENRIDARLTAIGLPGPRDTASQAIRQYEILADEALATRSLAELEARALPERIRSLKYALRGQYLDRAVVVAAVESLLLLERLAALPGFADTPGAVGRWRGSRLPAEGGGGRDFVGSSRPAAAPRPAIPLPPSADMLPCSAEEGAVTAVRPPGGDLEDSAETRHCDQSSFLAAVNMPHGCGRRIHQSPIGDRDKPLEEAEASGRTESRLEHAPRIGTKAPPVGESDRSRAGGPGAAHTKTGERRSRRAAPTRPPVEHRGTASLRPLWIALTVLNVGLGAVLGAGLLSTRSAPRITVSERYHTFTLPTDIDLPIEDARRFDGVLVLTVDRRWARLSEADRQGLVAHLARHLLGRASIERLLLVDPAGRRLGAATSRSIELNSPQG